MIVIVSNFGEFLQIFVVNYTIFDRVKFFIQAPLNVGFTAD